MVFSEILTETTLVAVMIMRVLHLRDTKTLCGPGKTILETVRLSDEPHIEYEVAAFGPPSSDYLALIQEHCPAFGLPEFPVFLPAIAARLTRHIRRRGVSIIHSHDFKTRVLATLVSRFVDVVLVTTVHGHIEVNLKSRLRNRADMRLFRFMDSVFAVSQAMIRQLQDAGVVAERIAVVRNSIALANYPYGYRSTSLRRSLGYSDTHKVLGCIGRLSPEKGQRDLLAVFPALLEHLPEVRLLVVGDGPDRTHLQKQARRLGVDSSLSFLGHRTDVLDILGSLDAFVLSSRSEGLPNVILEAMAVGVPVVATAAGGVSELVNDGETGVLVRPGRSLLQGIISTLQSRAASEERTKKARALVEREFDMKLLVHRTHEIYRQLLKT